MCAACLLQFGASQLEMCLDSGETWLMYDSCKVLSRNSPFMALQVKQKCATAYLASASLSLVSRQHSPGSYQAVKRTFARQMCKSRALAA